MWQSGDWVVHHGAWLQHDYWWGWFMPFGGFWFVILLVVLFAVLLLRSPHRYSPPPPARRSAALDMLEERYAKGEIGREEYFQKRADILGQHNGSAPTQ